MYASLSLQTWPYPGKVTTVTICWRIVLLSLPFGDSSDVRGSIFLSRCCATAYMFTVYNGFVTFLLRLWHVARI